MNSIDKVSKRIFRTQRRLMTLKSIEDRFERTKTSNEHKIFFSFCARTDEEIDAIEFKEYFEKKINGEVDIQLNSQYTITGKFPIINHKKATKELYYQNIGFLFELSTIFFFDIDVYGFELVKE